MLGKNFLLGKTFLSYQSKIAILIKDIEYLQALEYLPNKAKYKELKESIIFLSNNEFCVDLYLKINYSPRISFILKDKTTSELGFAKILDKTKKIICFNPF
ncbi:MULTISPECIES: type VI secretion system baseplate subunit TssG [unclassified Campylobacter]|uniref:type VI secretion system baseplate subunit TssG n=1 Tax=unclassified Campylobacter TaxID=2593542 RepID=UPI0021DFA090|nr:MULTISPECIES: type VI secretion system baseplate subunit TssG [unclassified Campylobacter]